MFKLPKKIFISLSSDGNFSSHFLNLQGTDLDTRSIHSLAPLPELDNYLRSLTPDTVKISITNTLNLSAIEGNFETFTEQFDANTIYIDFDLEHLKIVESKLSKEFKIKELNYEYTKQLKKTINSLDNKLKIDVSFKSLVNGYVNQLNYGNDFKGSSFLMYRILKDILKDIKLKDLGKGGDLKIVIGPNCQKYYSQRSLVTLLARAFPIVQECNLIFDKFGIITSFLFQKDGEVELFFNLTKYLIENTNQITLISISNNETRGNTISKILLEEGVMTNKLFGLAGLLIEYTFNEKGKIKVIFEKLKKSPIIILNATGTYYFDIYTDNVKKDDFSEYLNYLAFEKNDK